MCHLPFFGLSRAILNKLKKGRWHLSILILLSAPGLAQESTSKCAPLTKTDFSIEELQAKIRDRSCDIRTVYDAIQILPTDLKKNYAAFYKSRSLQGPSTIDYKRPRVLVFGDSLENSKSVVSFNSGDPSQGASNSLEVLKINPDGNKTDVDIFKYYDIQFPSDHDGKALSWTEAQKQIHLSDPNPAKCKTCHGEHPRPIFPGYPIWEGSFGSLHSHEAVPAEVEGLKSFEAELAKSGQSRYKALAHPTPFITNGTPIDFFEEANNQFNGGLGNFNGVRVARLLKQTPDFDKFRYAILGGLLRCDDYSSFFPAGLRDDLLHRLDRKFVLSKTWTAQKTEDFVRQIQQNKYLFLISNLAQKFDNFESVQLPLSQVKENVARAFGQNQDMMRLYLDTFEHQGISRADPLGANLRLCLQSRDIEINEYFLDLTQPTYRFHNGAYAETATIHELAKIDDGLDSDIKPALQKDYLESDRDLCDKLKKKSLEALAKYHAPSSDTKTEASTGQCSNCTEGIVTKGAKNLAKIAEIAKKDPHYPITFLNTCAKCHDGKELIAPVRIPFNSPDKMKAWLADKEHLAKIMHKVTSLDENEKMPPFRFLTDSERTSIVGYLKK